MESPLGGPGAASATVAGSLAKRRGDRFSFVICTRHLIYRGPHVTLVSTAVVFEMLSDGTRRRLVEKLMDGERSVGDLVSDLDITQPGVSRHLRILRESGLVQVRPDGQRRLYSLRPQPFRELARWMQDYRELGEARLDRLGDLIDKDEARSRSSEPKSRGRRA